MTEVKQRVTKCPMNEDTISTADTNKLRLSWRNVIIFFILHVGALYGLYLMFTKAKWMTCVFAYNLYVLSVVGVTAGAHRLWSHKAYKAKLPMKIILVVFQTLAFQGSVFQWVRDHRVHHKYTDTDADPHNSRRGFFFSHIGWLLQLKHPSVSEMGRVIDLSDIYADKLLTFQRKYYFQLVFLFCYVIPTTISLLWNENPWTAFFIAAVLRHVVCLHSIFLVNSAAHMWGMKPYDKDICPAETLAVSLVAGGEGFHNFHHTFPWDYRTTEFGGYLFNTSRLFIDTMAKIGWAYDLRTASEELIEKRVMRTGDGTHPFYSNTIEY